MNARAWRLQARRNTNVLRAAGSGAVLLGASGWAGVALAAGEQQFGSGAIVASGVVGGGLNAAARAAEAASQAVVTGSAVPSLGLSAMFQAAFGLLLVIGLILGCAWIARRFGANRQAPRTGLLKYVSSMALSQKERVVVIEIEDTWLVLGVAPGSVNHLHTLPARAASSPAASPNVSQFAMDFRQRLSEKLGKSARRDDSGSAS
jgi:flagellar protein FliO/FliZ